MEIEFWILDWLQSLRTPFLDTVMPMITSLGNGGICWIALTAVLLAVPRTRQSGWVMAAALLTDLVLCNLILKNVIARTRPYDIYTGIELLIAKPGDYSFPSGHTAASFASVAALYFSGENKLWKIAAVVSVLIAFSRMYLYVHFPTDILGGIAVGVLSGWLGYQIVRRVERRKITRQFRR